jgi:DNA transformation protein
MSDILFVMRGQSPYVEFLIEQFEPLGQITARAMFGGHCLYCDDTVFAIVAGSSLFLKTDEENRGDFVNRGLPPFKPFEDRDDTMSYFQAPPEVFEDTDAMRQWVGGSISAGLRASRSRPPRARKRRVP